MDATQTPYYIIRDALCRAEIIAGATQLIGQIAVPLANARAALAELERAAAQKFEAPEVDDAMAHRIAEDVFNALDEGRVCADDGRKMIAAVRSELGPTLGLVTREEMERHGESEYNRGYRDGYG